MSYISKIWDNMIYLFCSRIFSLNRGGKKQILQLCKFAREGIDMVDTNNLLLNSVNVAEAWCKGEATVEELRTAVDAHADYPIKYKDLDDESRAVYGAAMYAGSVAMIIASENAVCCGCSKSCTWC